MRIAYVALYLDKDIVQGGVGEKIRTQMKFWRDFGHDVKLFTLSPDDLNLEGASVFQYTSRKLSPFLKLVTRFFARSVAMAKLADEVQRYCPDFVYLRNGLYVYPLHRIFKVAPMVAELNSYDISEYRYQGWFVYWVNRLTRGLALKSASGLVSTSYEIAEISDNARYDKPVKVIGNGIDLDRNIVLPAPANKIPVITLVGSPGMIWHGVDKLIRLAERCPDLMIYIVGYRSEDIDGYIPENVHLCGFLPREQVRNILKMSDVACGTLALHRKNMEEASPLKVREAAACGIPLILGYRDTDLSGLQMDCILQLPNTEDNVVTHAEQIRAFAYRMVGKRLDMEAVKSCIGHKQKEETRLRFFEELVQKHVGQK
jgi:glycosyltransferase involved in cell wall biosynthesis